MEKELFNVSAVLNVLNKKIIDKKNEDSDVFKYEEVFFGCEEEFSKYENSKLLSKIVENFSTNFEEMNNVR